MNRRALLLGLVALSGLKSVQAQAATSAVAVETYRPGQTYLLSLPFADAAAATATTTAAKAFTLPPTSGNVQNYVLYRYDPLTKAFVQLSANSPLRRGEGYTLKAVKAVSQRTPSADRTRVATAVTQFSITLRCNPSDRSQTRGFNLIGFPFNPALYTSASWLEATVIGPNGRVYPSLGAAVTAGLISPILYSASSGSTTATVTQTLAPFRGYYAQTYVDNVRVVLKAKR